MRRPSGDHDRLDVTTAPLERRVGRPPPRATTETTPAPRKASLAPSGDQAGSAPAASTRVRPVATSVTAMRPWGPSGSRMGGAVVYAISRPSGDQVGYRSRRGPTL